ncbi:MAG TPA: cell surface protein SprA, partial [Gemmatimonadales bacterium]|nr:cell surface protein SprA [Gemmatimonadales bacterium]
MRQAASREAALWGQTFARSFGPAALPDSAGAIQTIANLPLPPTDSVARAGADSTRAGDLLAQYSDIGLQLNTRIEAKAERNKNERCTTTDLLVPTSNCTGSFQPQFDFQFNVKTGGTVADRVHVNVDYDSEREFDASNNINVYYEGKPDEILHRLEVGNVSFVPPPSRFITSGIPAGNYGLQATGQLGPMTFRTILAQQKGNVVKDRVFTVGDRTMQGADRDIEDYQVERRRFFWVVDPAREFPDLFPNIDVLDASQLATLVQRLPPDRRPRRVLVYRYRPPSATAAGGSRDINGPYAVTLGAHNRNEIGPYEVLQQGVDYYIDPSNLWISLVTPIVRGERLAVSYTVTGPGGAETTVGSVGGTLPTQRGAAGADTVVLLWDNDVLPGDSAFTREMRNVYRLGGEDIERGSVELKIVVGSGSDQERSQGPGAPTYLQLFGLAQPTNPSAFDAVNRLWPRDADPNLATNAGGGSAKLIRDYFVVFPSLRPFADSGRVDPPDPVNDSLYRTPDEDLFSQRRPPTQYRLHVRYQSRGGGDFGTLALGSVQIRQGSENLSINGVPLRRDVDYRVDYELGQVTFLRPDTLFAQPRQVTVRYEENPLFATAPTSIFGLATEFPLANNGRLGFTVISQSQRTTFNRPPLGFEPASALVAGVNGTFNWEAAPLTRMLDRLPGVTATAPSYVSLQGEFATSRPQPNSAGSAYVESFEGEGGVPLSLAEASWRVGSQPAISGTGAKIGATTFDFDTAAAATIAWQNLGYAVDSLTGRRTPLQFYPDQIDPLISFTGRSAFRVPEQLLWLTLFPRSRGGFWCADCSPP